MKEERLEKRMYFFVPYNISDIQKGIQAGHAAMEYARLFGQTEEFQEFVTFDKTWIILNGGTTRDGANEDERGSLNNIRREMYNNNIRFADFREPDLNNALTAVCFIADERVFNRKDYPNFKDWLMKNYDEENYDEDIKDNYYYSEWVTKVMNSKQNAFLRELITGKSLA